MPHSGLEPRSRSGSPWGSSASATRWGGPEPDFTRALGAVYADPAAAARAFARTAAREGPGSAAGQMASVPESFGVLRAEKAPGLRGAFRLPRTHPPAPRLRRRLRRGAPTSARTTPTRRRAENAAGAPARPRWRRLPDAGRPVLVPRSFQGKRARLPRTSPRPRRPDRAGVPPNRPGPRWRVEDDRERPPSSEGRRGDHRPPRERGARRGDGRCAVGRPRARTLTGRESNGGVGPPTLFSERDSAFNAVPLFRSAMPNWTA